MLEQVLSGVAPPVVVISLALWLRRWCGCGDTLSGSLVAGSLGAGVFIAGVLLDAWPIPPVDSKAWLLCALLLSAAWGLTRRWPPVFWVGGGAVMVIGARFLLGGSVAEAHPWKAWGTGEALAHWLGCAAALLAAWGLFAGPAKRQRGPLPLTLASGCAGTAAYVLMQGGSASLAQYVGALAIGLLCLAAAASRAAHIRLDAAVGMTSAWVLGGCLILGNYLADTDGAAAGLCLATPLALLVAARPSLQSQPLKRWALSGAVFALTASLAIWRAFVTAPAPYDY